MTAAPHERKVQLWMTDLVVEPSHDLSLLSEPEQERAAELAAPARAGYVARRSVIRRLLGAAVERRPGDLVIERRCPRCEKPHPVPLQVGGRPLWWSASSTGELLALATAVWPVGVDLESLHSHRGWREVARRFFVADEVETIGDQEGRFITYWTLKEAFLKALGIGLMGGLEKLDCTVLALEPDGWLRSSAYPGWCLRSLVTRHECVLALALRGAPASVAVELSDNRGVSTE